MTNNSVRQTLTESVLHWLKTARPDDSDAPSVLVDKILADVREGLPEERRVNWDDISTSKRLSIQSEANGFNTAIVRIKEILK